MTTLECEAFWTTVFSITRFIGVAAINDLLFLRLDDDPLEELHQRLMLIPGFNTNLDEQVVKLFCFHN